MTLAPRAVVLLFAVALAARLSLAAETPAQTGVASPAPGAPKTLSVDLPPGDGREIVIRLCSDCHTLVNVLTRRYSPQGWEDEVSDMIGRGLVITDDEFEKIVDYLRVQFGRVNVNKASMDDIRMVLELTPAQARAVIAARDRAPLPTLDELKRVPGLDGDAIEKRKDRVVFRE